MEINVSRLSIALEEMTSGAYPKGRGYLCRPDGSGGYTWCCLGVLTDVAISRGWARVTRAEIPASDAGLPAYVQLAHVQYDGSAGLLCAAVSKAYGIEDPDPDLKTPEGKVLAAAEWNDWGPGDVLLDPGVPHPEEDFTAIAEGFRRAYLTQGDDA